MLRRAWAALFLLVLAGCQVRADVTVHADAAGTGRVEVAVTLDKQAAARAAGTRPRTDDLVRAGWKVHPAVRPKAGGVVYRVEKRFGSPEEAARVLGEVNRTVLRDFVLTRQRSFLKTRTTLRGAIDLRDGAAALGDPDLTALLGGQPLGVEPARVTPLDQALQVAVNADLPGRTAHWTARSGTRVAVATSAERWNVRNIAGAVVAVAALAAFAVSGRRALRPRRS